MTGTNEALAVVDKTRWTSPSRSIPVGMVSAGGGVFEDCVSVRATPQELAIGNVLTESLDELQARTLSYTFVVPNGPGVDVVETI
jgi:hypothetical protein